MNELRKNCLNSIKELEIIIKCAENDLKNAPNGALRVSKNKNAVQYYWRTDSKDTHGKYIKRSEESLVQQLAKKDYAKKILKIACKNRDKLKELLLEYHPEEMIKIYEQLPYSRRRLITPYVLSDESYAELWQKRKQEMKGTCRKQELDFLSEDSAILTESGECVRSKSEKILADKLYSMEIPYTYETPLLLKGYGYIKPDFTVLNKKTRSEYYWEHLGMMEDANYCEKAIKKIESYEKNQIYPGEKLILTYETSNHPINIKIVENLIQKYLL